MKLKEKNLFIIDHYYAINHIDFCIVVECEKSIDEMIEICSSIEFLLEETVDEAACLSQNCLLNILKKYYGATDKKPEAIKTIKKCINLPIDECYKKSSSKILGKTTYIMDLYECRESCCGKGSSKMMEKQLPKGKELEEIIEILKKYGVEN